MSELKKLRKEIQDKEAERNQAQGALTAIETSWKDDHGLESQEEVEAHVEKLDKKIEKLKTQYDEKVEAVKEKLEEME